MHINAKVASIPIVNEINSNKLLITHINTFELLNIIKLLQIKIDDNFKNLKPFIQDLIWYPEYDKYTPIKSDLYKLIFQENNETDYAFYTRKGQTFQHLEKIRNIISMGNSIFLISNEKVSHLINLPIINDEIMYVEFVGQKEGYPNLKCYLNNDIFKDIILQIIEYIKNTNDNLNYVDDKIIVKKILNQNSRVRTLVNY